MFEIRKISETIQIGILDLSIFSNEVNSNDKRQIEKSGTQTLLRKMLNKADAQILYSETGKPYLADSTAHISISHSHDKLVILINQKEDTGVDIELIRDKVRNIQHKFLSPAELLLTGNSIEMLVTAWALKEALYKRHGRKGLDFRANLLIESLQENNLIGKQIIGDEVKRYALKKEKLDNYILVYVLHEI